MGTTAWTPTTGTNRWYDATRSKKVEAHQASFTTTDDGMTITLKLSKVLHVDVTAKAAAAVLETFAWAFNETTKVLTIKRKVETGGSLTSGLTISLRAHGW